MQTFDQEFDDTETVEETHEDAVPSPPPSDDDDLNDIVSEVADEVSAEDGPLRDENGRFAKREDDTVNKAAEAVGGAEEGDGEQAEEASDWPEHLSDWTEEQQAALAALPEEAQAYLKDPQAVVEYVRENVREQMRSEYGPYLQQLEPLMQALQDPGTSDYLARRQHELGVSQHDIISNVLKTDAFLTYSTDTQARHQAAMQLLQNYGIDPVEMVLGQDGGQNYQQSDLQRQLANERWQRERMQNYLQHQQQQQTYSQTQNNVEAFASETDASGQPLRPMMNNPSVRASMGHLIASGQAQSLDHAYQMVVAPLEAEIFQRAQYLAWQQQQARQDAVKKSARARPVKVGTAQHGGKNDGQSLDDIISGVVSEMM